MLGELLERPVVKHEFGYQLGILCSYKTPFHTSKNTFRVGELLESPVVKHEFGYQLDILCSFKTPSKNSLRVHYVDQTVNVV